MVRVIVDVMPKPEILDPQGKAVHGALPRLGFERISDVRQGKRFELEVEVADEATLASSTAVMSAPCGIRAWAAGPPLTTLSTRAERGSGGRFSSELACIAARTIAPAVMRRRSRASS